MHRNLTCLNGIGEYHPVPLSFAQSSFSLVMNITQATCTIAAIAAVASSAIAQGNVTVPAHTSVYNGYSRGFSTVAQTNFDITEIELALDAFQPTDTASFLVQVNGVDVYHSFGGTNAINILPTPVQVYTGDTVMVIGNWSAVPTSNFGAHNSYAGGAGPYATTILGVAHTLDRAGYQCDIGDPASYATAGSFTGITGSLGRCFVTVAAGSGVPASVVDAGAGCGGEGLASFYEIQAPGVNDLQNKKIIGTKNLAGGYDVTIVPGAGFAVPFGSTNTMLGDDDQTVLGAFGTLGMVVGSNGWMSVGDGNSNGWSPTASAMLGNPSEGVYAWTDLQPNAAGSGAIYYSESGTVAAATYEGVYGWGQTDPNNIKLTYDTSNGDWSIEFEDTAATNPEPMLVGYSTAVDSGDGGSIDIFAAASFYEIQAAGVNDLQNQKIIGTKNLAGGYDVTIVAGTGFGVGFGTVNTNLGDDDSAPFGTLGMVVGSNGWMAVGAGNSNGWSPSAATMLGNPSEGVYAWTDLNPTATGSGSIYYGESGTVATATYNGVYGWGTADPNNIKIEYDTSNGDWSIEFETTGATNPEDLLVGYSTAGSSVDGGSMDIDVSAPFTTDAADGEAPFTTPAADSFDLRLTAIGLPLQQATAVSFDVTTSNIPSSAVSHLGILGLTSPGLALDAVGLPGCFLNASADVLSFSLTATPVADVTWTALTLPAGTAFGNVEFYVQSAIFGTSANGFLGLGAITSNGLQCTIGY
jgi:hypothetical protein